MSHRFIVEGLATVVSAVVAYLLLHDFPETAPFLTPPERAFVAYRLKYDGMEDSVDNSFRVPQNDDRDWKYVKQAFTDPIVYLLMLMDIGVVRHNTNISITTNN
jgi:hypothetical protein